MRLSLIFIEITVLVVIFVDSIPLKCEDHPKCRYWRNKGLCRSKIHDTYFKATICPIACGFCKKPTRKSPVKPYEVFKYAMDERVKPCDDFFKFACGRYQVMRGKAKKDSSRLEDVGEKVTAMNLKMIFDMNATSNIPVVQKMYTYRNTCLDVKRIESDKSKEFVDDINTLGGMPMLESTWPRKGTKFDFNQLLQKVGSYYVKIDETFVNFKVQRGEDGNDRLLMMPASLIMKKPENYLKSEFYWKKKALLEFLTELASFLAWDTKSTKNQDSIRTAIEKVIALETKIAQLTVNLPSIDGDPEKICNKKTIGDLERVFPKINFTALFIGSDMFPNEALPKMTPKREIYLYNEDVLTKLNGIIQKETDETLANYVILRLLLQTTPYLDSRFSSACNKFAQAIDQGRHVSSRIQDCYDSTNTHFATVVDYLFTQKFFNFNTFNKVDQMFENVRQAMHDMIRSTKWLSGSTKSAALKKLQQMGKMIGSVPYAKNAQSLEEYYNDMEFDAKNSYRQMSIKINRHLRWRNMMQLVIPGLDKFTDAKEMRTPIANAFHLPDQNYAFIPVGIMFSSSPQLPMSNFYGSLGNTIGHELSHGFDSNGANYDERGRRRNWWDEKTREEFEKRADCMVNQYSRFTIPGTNLKINGSLTLPENIADNAGIKAAFRGYKKFLSKNKDKKMPGYEKYTNEQIFFISAAIDSCDWQSRETRINDWKNDEHAAGFARINIPLINFPEFAKVFKCRVGTKMNPPRNKKCEIW